MVFPVWAKTHALLVELNSSFKESTHAREASRMPVRLRPAWSGVTLALVEQQP
jgi:hypothetical protein